MNARLVKPLRLALLFLACGSTALGQAPGGKPLDRNEKPLDARAFAGQVRNEKPLDARALAGQVRNEKPLDARALAGQVRNEKPFVPSRPLPTAAEFTPASTNIGIGAMFSQPLDERASFTAAPRTLGPAGAPEPNALPKQQADAPSSPKGDKPVEDAKADAATNKPDAGSQAGAGDKGPAEPGTDGAGGADGEDGEDREDAEDAGELTQGLFALTPLDQIQLSTATDHPAPTGSSSIVDSRRFADLRELRMEQGWSPSTLTWCPTNFAHRPLYFEDPLLERHGQARCDLVQPFWSAAHFFGTFPILPYKLGIERPYDCVYSYGYGRPGSCKQSMRYKWIWEADAAAFESSAWIAAVFLLP